MQEVAGLIMAYFMGLLPIYIMLFELNKRIGKYEVRITELEKETGIK